MKASATHHMLLFKCMILTGWVLTGPVEFYSSFCQIIYFPEEVECLGFGRLITTESSFSSVSLDGSFRILFADAREIYLEEWNL